MNSTKKAKNVIQKIHSIMAKVMVCCSNHPVFSLLSEQNLSYIYNLIFLYRFMQYHAKNHHLISIDTNLLTKLLYSIKFLFISLSSFFLCAQQRNV